MRIRNKKHQYKCNTHTHTLGQGQQKLSGTKSYQKETIKVHKEVKNSFLKNYANYQSTNRNQELLNRSSSYWLKPSKCNFHVQTHCRNTKNKQVFSIELHMCTYEESVSFFLFEPFISKEHNTSSQKD